MRSKFLSSVSGISLSLILGLTLFSCSSGVDLGSPSVVSSHSSKVKFGMVKINLSSFTNKSFGIKADFNSAAIGKIKVEVLGFDFSNNVSGIFDWKAVDAAGKTISLNVPAGKNRVISITGLDSEGKSIARIMGLADIIADSANVLSVDYAVSTPAASVMLNILNSNRKDLARKIDGKKLEKLVMDISEYDRQTNSYGNNRPNPRKIDVFSIAQKIIFNDGEVPNDANSFLNEVSGLLKVKVLDAQGNPITSGVELKLNDISHNTVVTNSASTLLNADSGVWELTAKAFVNASGNLSLPLNDEQEREVIINGGNRLYAKKAVTIKNTQEQEIVLQLEELEVKEIELYEEETKKERNFEVILGDPLDLEAKVIFADDTYAEDEVIWKVSDKNIISVTPDGLISGLKEGSVTLTLESIVDDDISKDYYLTVKNFSNVPQIKGFSPEAGNTGTIVTISGRNFDDLVPENNIVRFNGVKAEVLSATTETLRVKVPQGPTRGYISVEGKKGKDLSDSLFVGDSNFTDMVEIPSGTFIMGSPDGSGGPSEHPQLNNVSVERFRMDKYEVTNEQYKEFMKADGYNNSVFWTAEGWNWKNSNNITQPLFWNDSRFNQPEQPVVGVSWYEASAFARWAGKRLPTEAEWEKAARGTTGRLFPWGNQVADQNRTNAYFGSDGMDDGFKFLAPVGSFDQGQNPEGVYDLSGNALEWVADWYQFEYYGRDSGFVNPSGPLAGSFKVARGGAWNYGTTELSSSYRDLFFRPESRNFNLGFRCVTSN